VEGSRCLPVVEVSRWLGRAQPTITLNVYGDWAAETADKSVAKAGGARCGCRSAEALGLSPTRRPTSHRPWGRARSGWPYGSPGEFALLVRH
jgi:hypothetical protein